MCSRRRPARLRRHHRRRPVPERPEGGGPAESPWRRSCTWTPDQLGGALLEKAGCILRPGHPADRGARAARRGSGGGRPGHRLPTTSLSVLERAGRTRCCGPWGSPSGSWGH
ncbi:hypothetical protein QJS66_12680 [Kocuria rhizophila]|nr:hypothetical protein QJS66_12680 [Kocuria rhizophila]